MAYANSEMAHGHTGFEGSSDHSNRENEMGMGVMIVVVALASMMGLWGFSCIASGLFHSGGIFQFGASWLGAVFGR